MKYGVPVLKIAYTSLLLIAVLIASGTLLIVTNHEAQGNNLISIGIGVVVGTGATTGIVTNNARTRVQDDRAGDPQP